MAQVFFSYAHNDHSAALPIIEAFGQVGVSVWHHDLASSGELIAEKMRRELETSQCVVVLWSRAAAQSDFVQREIQQAIQAWSSGRLILAVLDDALLPVGLRDLSPVLIHGKSESGTKQLIERAQAIIGRTPTLPAEETAAQIEPKYMFSIDDSGPSKAAPICARSRLTISVVMGRAAGLIATLLVTYLLYLAASDSITAINVRISSSEAPLQEASKEQLERRREALEEIRREQALRRQQEMERHREEAQKGPSAPPGIASLWFDHEVTLKELEKRLEETKKELDELKARAVAGHTEGGTDSASRTVSPAAELSSIANQPPTGPVTGPAGQRLLGFPSTEYLLDTRTQVFTLMLAMLVLAVVIGAAAVWVRRSRSRRRSHRALSASSTVQSQPMLMLSNDPRHAPSRSADVPQVFISYSRQDLGTVDLLIQHIEQLGFAVWIDRQSAGQQRYAGPIVSAIRMSRIVALMCSRDAFISDHVIREIYIAGDLKKPFIIFQLDRAEFPDEVLYFISGFPRVALDDVDPQHLRTEIARLIAA